MNELAADGDQTSHPGENCWLTLTRPPMAWRGFGITAWLIKYHVWSWTRTFILKMYCTYLSLINVKYMNQCMRARSDT